MSRVLPPQVRRWRWSTWINIRNFAIAVGVILGLNLVAYMIAEWLWFDEVGYAQIFIQRWLTQMGLGILAGGCSAAWLLGHLWYAHRWQHLAPVAEPSADSRGVRLRLLLPLTLGLAMLLGLMLLYQGQIVQEYWQPNLTLASRPNTLPLQFRPAVIVEMGQQLGSQLWSLGLAFSFAIAWVIYPTQVSVVAAGLMSIGFSLVLSEQWIRVLPFFQPTAFNITDPLFNQDVSFYVFRLPILQLVEFWWVGLCSFSLTAVALIYFLSGNSLSQGRFPGFTTVQKRHLCGLSGGLMLAISLGHWLARYELLYSPRGVTYGASFTDIKAQLPIDSILAVTAFGIAIALLNRSIFWGIRWEELIIWLQEMSRKRLLISAPIRRRSMSSRPIIYALGLYLMTATILGLAIPIAVQSLIVQPNELERERPYIRRTIEFTRNAFGLNDINSKIFVPQGNLDAATLQANDLTIRNIRLWDTRPLLESNRQLQQIRLYYEFPDADIDRYTIKQPDGTAKRRQVLISARELNYERVPDEAKTWVNEHLIYTHGYGFTMSPVNTAGESGLPEYFIQDIAHNASNERIRSSIPVGDPRIYFGELTNTYIMTQTEVQELDYPSGSDNVYTRYEGRGGINIGALWRRLLFARHLRDWKMLFTQDFTPDTRLIFRRNIGDRVRTIAPFLRYDSDPYLVVSEANFEDSPDSENQPEFGDFTSSINQSQGASKNYLYWIIDAYTTSDRYPYSDPAENDFNYIRNSVKVVIDAYHGTVYFYVADASDPIIQTWSKIFPGMMRSLEDMPFNLRSHIRYPQDFYQVQSSELMTYHMTDPQVFYNREDQWRAPNEIYGSEAQRVEPYYLIMKLPDEETEEFVLLRPYTPAQRNNMIAWLAARSDRNSYGTMLLYRFPKQELVFGPEQIEARINQDPVISQRISLWNRQGSRAIQGNLLVIPIADSLLYVEPLYLEAEQNSLPILARVIVVYQNQIAMAETLNEALDAIFQPENLESSNREVPTIIRNVDEAEESLLNIDPDLAPAAPDTPNTGDVES